jgi:hypothetical protein
MTDETMTWTNAQVDWLIAYSARLTVNGVHPDDVTQWTRSHDPHEFDFEANPVDEANSAWQEFFSPAADAEQAEGPIDRVMTDETMTLEERVLAFMMMKLPGQLPMMHMGTSYLVNDLCAEIKRLESAIAERKATTLTDALLALEEYALAGVTLGTDDSERLHATVNRIAPIAERTVPDAAIYEELDRAVAKFPTWPTDPLHALAVLGEEFGELTKAALQLTYEPGKSSREEVNAEAIQTAAMAIRFVRSLDVYCYARRGLHPQTAAPKVTP